jgi:sugar phosphate isomerase/epimerase
MPHALSLHHLSNLDITAPELIRAAHGAGFSHVCLFTMHWPSPDFAFPVVTKGPLLDETRAALADTGVKVFNTDAPFLWPDVDVTRYEPGLEIAASFGAKNATAVIGDPDVARATDNFGKLYELARGYGINACVEFMMMGTVNSIEAAESMVRAAGALEGSIAVDTLHLVRTGGSAAKVAKLDPKLIGNIQINDGPATMPEGEPQIVEAMTARLWPGQGVFPLKEIIAALPEGAPFSVEAPNDAQRKSYPDVLSWAKALHKAASSVVS